MKLTSKAVICGLAVAAVSAAGCSGNPSSKTTGHQGGPSTGEIGLNLTLPGGAVLNSLNYTLSNGITADGKTGIINLPTTTVTTLPFSVPTQEIVPVQAGSNYVISLTGTSTDGTVTCTGTSAPPFTVSAGLETQVGILVSCVKATDAGSIMLTVTTQNCPSTSTLTPILNVPVTNPVTTQLSTSAPNNTATIFASANSPNNAALTYTFSVTGGHGTLSGQSTVADNSSSSILFTCPATSETDTITLVTADGSSTCSAASTTSTTQVICGTPAPACTGVGTGVEATPDTTAGTCPAGSSNTLVDSSGNFCCATNPPCQGVGSGVEATPDTAAGTCPTGQSNSLKDANGNFCCVGLQPCTTVGQTNCVQCSGNANGVCTPTEATFVAYDIKNNVAKTSGADPSNSCYSCLFNNSCIDDTLFSDVGHECEDGTFVDSLTSGQCEGVISCVLGSGAIGATCAQGGIVNCYCGAEGLVAACTANPSTVTGTCVAQIAGGLAFASSDGTDIVNNFTDLTKAGGRADQIFACGIQNNCNNCF